MPQIQEADTSAHVYSVSDLNLAVRAILDEAFDTLWIQGEISNFACPRSGHWYFTLKDSKAQIKCAMFRGANWQVGFQPENGMEVLLFAKVSLYPERGDYQLIAESMQLSGEGQLQKAFEKLKKKLSKEGLFKKEHKKPLPDFPKSVGVITSKTGAALRDILSVLERRYPILQVNVYPSMVQGQGASESIIKAIKYANKHKYDDVLILARGGGSLEDLWSFNDEALAYAVFESKLPIITGVGHETDFTLVDYVADERAPTPSAAAETVSPDGQGLLEALEQMCTAAGNKILREIYYLYQRLDHLEKRLVSPEKQLSLQQEQVTDLVYRAKLSIQNTMSHAGMRFHHVVAGINPQILKGQLDNHQQKVKHYLASNRQVVTQTIKQAESRTLGLMRTLHAVSPFATLDRGYSITTTGKTVLSSVKELKKGQAIETKLKDGIVKSEVIEIMESSDV